MTIAVFPLPSRSSQPASTPDDLDTGFGADEADGDKELKFVVQEIVPSGTRNFSVTLASTGSSSQRRYSFVAGGSTGSIDATTDPGGIVRSVSYIASTPHQQKIRDRAPSDYIGAFKKDNTDIRKALNSHFIDIEDFGIENDDYETFLKARPKRIFGELKSCIETDPFPPRRRD